MSVAPEPKILILDDDPIHCASVRDLLAIHHYSAETTTDASDALERLQRGEFHLLILDINMPRITGIDVLKYLDDHEVDVKTIVLSGETAVATITPILRLGAYDYLPKPYEPQQLLTSVANAVERFRLEQTNMAMAAKADADHALHEFLVTASPDWIYVLDEDGRVTFTNERVQQIFDRAPDDVQGRPWHEVVGSELKAPLEHLFNERRTGERATRQLEFEYKRPGERTRILEFSATGLYDDREDPASSKFRGTYGVLRDVTENRRTARELAQSRMKFYGLFKDNPDASYIVRLSDGKLLEANDSFREIQTLLNTLNEDNDRFIFASESARQAFLRRLMLHPNDHTTMVEREGRDGMRYLELTAKLLTLNDEQCVLTTVRDRTEARRAEMDRLNLQNRLQQASKMEAIGQLAGGIAHDFNNILASIIGYAELIQNAQARFSAEQVHDYLNEVITAGHRARDLISQMLTFTRANRGDPRPLDLVATINDVSRMLRAAIPSHIDINTQFGDHLDTVHADPIQLQQIVINLLVNARDAIEGPGWILVDAQRGQQPEPCAACGERLEEDHIVLSVTDTGHGIPDDVRERMFEMYFTTREPGRGTGIGLWLINNLIHEYSGHVTVESAAGQGSTFRVHLPLAESMSDGTGERPAPTAVQAAGRVVVVDDEVSVGNFIGEVLRDAGYEVILFNESPSALRYIEANQAQIALVLTDQNMPLMDGLELATQVKRVRADLPVVLITGFAENQKTRRWHKLGIDAFLAKPFRIDALLGTIADLAPEAAPRTEWRPA